MLTKSVKVLFGSLILILILQLSASDNVNISADKNIERKINIDRSKRAAFLGFLTNVGRITFAEASAVGAASSAIQHAPVQRLNKDDSIIDRILKFFGFGDSEESLTTTTQRPEGKIIPSRTMPAFAPYSKASTTTTTTTPPTTTTTAAAAKTIQRTEWFITPNRFHPRRLGDGRMSKMAKRDVSAVQAEQINELSVNERSRRFAPAVLVPAAKVLGLAGLLIGANAVSSVIDTDIKANQEEKFLEKIARISIDCNYNHFGCLDNLCWANCGPRLSSGDWCYTSNKTQELKNSRIQAAVTCNNDQDCNKCWPCVSTCKKESIAMATTVENSGALTAAAAAAATPTTPQA